MNAKLVTDLIAFAMTLKFLEGYRTYIAAAGLFGAAVYRVSIGDYSQGVTDLSLALAALGIRSKLEPPPVHQDTSPAEPPSSS